MRNVLNGYTKWLAYGAAIIALALVAGVLSGQQAKAEGPLGYNPIVITGVGTAYAGTGGIPDVLPGGANSCLEDLYGGSTVCTANDVDIANVTNVVVTDPCLNSTDTATFTATYEIELNAQTRYDVGLWFATDGDVGTPDGALTGQCTVASLPSGDPPEFYDAEGNACGDISSLESPMFVDIELTVQCDNVDDTTGLLKLATCTSWLQNEGDADSCDLLPTPPDPVLYPLPGTKSKCNCDPGNTVPIAVGKGLITVDKIVVNSNGTPLPADPELFDFELDNVSGDPAFVPTGFDLASASEPYISAPLITAVSAMDPQAVYSVAELGPLPAGYAFLSANCTGTDGLDQDPSAITVHRGETVNCTFINEADTTAIELASFTAEASADSNVNIAWTTATEIDNAGFNVYRSTSDNFSATNANMTQVNSTLIASQASLGMGASYSVVDESAVPGVWYYFLEDIDYNGTLTHHGPVMVDTSAPTSVGQSGFAGIASSSLLIMIALSLAAAALALFAYQRRKNTV